MRARIKKQDIFPAIMRAVSIADRKSVMPILSHVLLDFQSNGLTIKSTDLDHSLIETIPADIDTFGTVAVPAATFNDIIRKTLDDAPLEFSLADKGERLVITADKAKFELSTLDCADFPATTQLNNSCNFTVKAADFNKLISRTKFSISPEESRHNLNGIYLHKEEDMLKAASTDGHRLSVSEMPLNSKENIQGVIISKKTVLELKKLLDIAMADVSIRFNANQVQFTVDNIIFIAKLVDGVFPDYKRVIPDKTGDSFVVKRTDFMTMVDRVSVMSDDKVRAVRLEATGGSLRCSVASNKLGSGRDETAIEYNGAGWSAGFNAMYLLDVAQTLEGEKLRVHIKESLSPILIEDESEPQSLFVIMPMRI